MSAATLVSKIKLTVLQLSDDRGGVQRSSHSKLVDSRNPELVLVSFYQLCGIKGAFLALISNHCPRYLGCLTLLDKVVRNLGAAIVLWRAPGQSALALGDTAEGDGSHRLPRCVYTKKQANLILHIVYAFTCI